MRPELFRIPLPDFLPMDSIPVRGYGTMLAIGFLLAIAVAAWRARREREDPNHVYNAAILALLGGVVGARVFDVLEYGYRYPQWWHGFFLWEGMSAVGVILGAVGGAALALLQVLPWSRRLSRESAAAQRKRRKHGGGERGVEIRWPVIVVWAVVGALVAGRGVYVKVHADAYAGFIEALKIQSGGLTVYGGLLLATALVVPYLVYIHRRRGVNPLKLADIVAPSLALGLAFGRMGCFLNGCCFGAPCDLPWCFAWPKGSLPYNAYMERGWSVMPAIHPAQLYGVLNGLLLFALLHLGYRHKRRHGMVLGAFFALYAVSRFLLEGIRSDEAKVYLGGMSISQTVSVFAIVPLVFYFVYLWRSRLARLDGDV